MTLDQKERLAQMIISTVLAIVAFGSAVFVGVAWFAGWIG